MPGRDLFANDPPKKKGRDLFAIPAPSQRQGTPDFQNAGMDLVSEGGARSYKSKEERLRDNAAERRLAMAQKRVDQGPKQVGSGEAFGIGGTNSLSLGNYAGVMASGEEAARQGRRMPGMTGNPLPYYIADKVGDFLNPGNESQARREGYEDKWQERQGTAAMENPLSYMGGEVAGYFAPGVAAWKSGAAMARALPFADDVARFVGKTRAGSYAGRLAGSTAAFTGDAALFGTTVGASDEQAIAAAQGQPIEMTPADRLKVGKQYATASVPVKTPFGEVPLPINALMPVAGSAVMRGGNVLRKGYATPDEIAARVYNNQGRVPFRGNAASSIAATGQTLNGTVTPNNIRGFRGIENALTDALEGVEINGRPITKREIRDRIATGFDNIRQSVPSLDEPGIDLARLIEREFANDAPQIQETIRRFLLKVGLDGPAGRALIQNATNQIRGQQADVLTNDLNRLGDQSKQEVKDILKGNKKLIQEEGYAKALGGLNLESPGQQEALNLLSGGPEYKTLLGEAARNAGLSVDDFVLRNPLEALHEVRSKLLQRAREMRDAGSPNYDLEDLTSQMADVLDSNVPGYNQLRNMYRSEAQAFDRLGTTRGPEGGTGGEGKYNPGFGEKMLSPTNTPREEGRQTFKQIFDAMDPKSKRAAAISVRDVILADLDKVNAAGLEERYAAAAKLQKIKTEGGLAMMEEVFGEEGRAIANRVRQFVDANQYSRDIDPAFNSLTTNKQTAMQTGDIPFSSSLGRAMNKAGTSLSDSAAADLALVAFGGPPIATLMRGSPKVAALLRPKGRTPLAIAETLLRQPGQNPPRGPRVPPAPITPLTQNDLPRGVNALANNQSGFMRPDAAGAIMSAGGAGVGAMNPIDFDGDGKTSAKERAMTAALYGGAAYGVNRGVHGIDRLGRAPRGAATEFRVRPGESGSSKIQFRAGGERWADIPTGFGSEAEATAQMQRLQAGKPLQADVLYGPPKDEFEAMFRSWFEQTQGRTAPRFAEAIQNNNGLVGKALWEMDPSGETFARYLQKYDPEEWAQYMGPGGGADGKSFDAALGRVIDNLGNEVDSMTRPSGSNAGRDFNLETWNPNKPKSSGPAMFRHDLANAAVGGTVGGMGGSFSGEFTDYNGDGVIDETDKQIGFMIGTGLGAFGAPIGTRFGTPGNKFTRGAGPKTVKQAMRAELPGSPEYERAVAKGLDMSPQARMQRARDMGFDTDTVLYHGTATPFSEGKGIIWGSTKPDLANDYAAMRGHMNDRDRAAGKSVAENQGLVKALVARREKTFDADLMPKTVTAPEFLTTVLEQSGKNFSEAETARLRGLFDTVRKARLREESGPHYGRHDFWYEPETLFGKDGAKAITEIFDMAGFDSIKMIEDGQVTYGIRNPANIRSVNAAFDPDMAASPMLTAGPSGKLPKLMKDVPKGTRRPGERPNLSGTIQRGQEQTSGVPIAKAIGGEGLAYRTAKREAEDMMARNVDLEEIQRRTGLVPISYRGQMVWRGVDGEVTAYEANELFYEALKLPPAERPDWVKQVLEEIGPKVEPLNLGGKDAPLRLGGPNTPMRNNTAPNNVPRNALLGGLGAVGAGTAYYMSRDPKRPENALSGK